MIRALSVDVILYELISARLCSPHHPTRLNFAISFLLGHLINLINADTDLEDAPDEDGFSKSQLINNESGVYYAVLQAIQGKI